MVRHASAPNLHHTDVHVTLQNILMQLRKCCNHPYLIEYPLTPSVRFRRVGLMRQGDYLMDEGLVTSSGKMQFLDRVLPRLKREGHKVIYL